MKNATNSEIIFYGTYYGKESKFHPATEKESVKYFHKMSTIQMIEYLITKYCKRNDVRIEKTDGALTSLAKQYFQEYKKLKKTRKEIIHEMKTSIDVFISNLNAQQKKSRKQLLAKIKKRLNKVLS